jgi:hypothetical protein
MLTIIFRRSAAAGLLVLALASSGSIAKADWTITSSCVGPWGMRNCVVTQRDFQRDPYVRHVRGDEGYRDAPEAVERDRQESIARDRKWLAFCKPVLAKDQYGVERYLYAKPGCEFGRAE